MTKILAACLMLAAQTYQVPPAVLVGIHQVEGGTAGQAVGPNDNGSYDLGPMQINTIWIPLLAEKWGVPENTAYYQSRTPKFGGPYKSRVVTAMRSKGLLRDSNTR
jgi:hypothetical protein